MATAPSFELVGREDERALLEAFVEGLELSPAAVLVHGEPGIGKTALLRETVAVAERAGTCVLLCRCAEAEMPIPLGAVSDLLDSAFGQVAEALAEPQRRALAVALGIETDAQARPDRLALPRAVAAALSALAADAPVLIAIDDVQWLDSASVRVLAFAIRRTGDQPIGVVATLRGGPDVREPLGLADGFGAEAFARIELGPLSKGALGHLIGRRFDFHLPRSKLAAVHAASGGNPMFALEFARSSEREDLEVGGLLPVPSSLDQLVRDRVHALSEDARPLLEWVAVLERPTEGLLAQALGGSPAVDAPLDAAVSAGAISIGRGEEVRFTHPLLRSAVYFGMTPARRRAAHRDAAALVDDLGQRARHLALATQGADTAVAEVVEQAAADAAARGAPEAAAALAAEAVRLTPDEDDGTRVRRTFAVAGYLIEAGDIAQARAQIEPLLDPGVPGSVRAQALMMRAETEHRDRPLLIALLREAIETASDPRVRWHVWMRYAQHGGWVSGDAKTAADSALEALSIAIELNDPALHAASTAALAYYDATRGRRDRELDDEALLTAERVARTAQWQITPAISVGSRLMWAGELDRARDVLRSEYEELARQGSMLRLPLVLLPALVDLEWRAGRWVAAEAYGEEAGAILADALPGAAHVLFSARLLVAGSMGRVDEARRLAADGLRLAEQYIDQLNSVRISWAIGHVELAAGEPAAAWATLERLPEALDVFGIAEPAWHPILPDVVETLVALDRLDEGESVLRKLEAQAAALRHPWASAAAARCRAVLLLAHEHPDDAAEEAERAAADFERLGFPLDRARALLTAGAARRRAGQRRRAAETLRPAIEILIALGAPLWLERAEDELRRASPRPRRDRELTGAERRVAALVAEGMTNREVAAQLFTTVATVEAHLTRIYRKAGVRSRTELARAVADGTLKLDA